MSSLKYWIWLSTRTGVGPARVKKLIEFFGSPESVYNASERDYLDVEGIKPADITWLRIKEMDPVNKILSSCAETGCRIITFQDSNYPDRLRNIYDPPPVLYIKGNLPYIDEEAVVGVVGTRNCTPYGIITAESICCKLSEQGIIVATGLARGVDTAATKGALRGGSSTIGVIGSGIDIIYPPENESLFDHVTRAGAVISEYPPGTPAVKTHFPMRNRIISGISVGIAVIEAPKKSGALITASRALEQGRDVFTLPGNVDAVNCEGSNALLREGAIPFLSAEDIIDEYIELFPDKISMPDISEVKSGKPKEIKQKSVKANREEPKNSFDNITKVDYIGLGNLLEKLDGDEKCIVGSIGLKSLYIEDIILDTGLPVNKVLAVLTMLELSEYVKRDNSGKWEITGHS